MTHNVIKIAATLFFGTALSVSAQDFSEGSEAKEWGLYGEQKARFVAKVVDPLCELAGQCADDCGGGTRQLALVRSADDVMVLPLKNSQAAFTGAATELAPFCNQMVEVDGLLIEDPDVNATNVYMLQRIRAEGSEEWIKANRWTKEWAKANPDAKGKGPWFRRDPEILAEIEREGYFGLGADVDQAYLESLE